MICVPSVALSACRRERPRPNRGRRKQLGRLLGTTLLGKRVDKGHSIYPWGMTKDDSAPQIPAELETEHMNVESFNFDHRTVTPPFIRVADRIELPGGDVLIKYDVRFTKPNEKFLDMKTVHSIEHLTAQLMRNYTDRLIDFSPMGCQTGFYALTHDVQWEDFAELLADTFEDILEAEEVPAANEVQCGWGANHSLEGAKAAVSKFLEGRDEWAVVEANAID